VSRAIRIHETGGPEVLRWEELGATRPGPGEVLLRQTAIGVNFIDVYHRTGLYPLPLPAVLGREAAGVVEEVGPGVTEFRGGDRVAYALHPGAYAERSVVPATALVLLPAGVDDRTAAGSMLKGLTAWYLLRRCHSVRAGETVLIHAAAGGVGLVACQWAKHLGAVVIGTVGSDAKVAVADRAGCDEVLIHGRDDVVARVRARTSGVGVPVVYDSIGRDTFETSLDCLSPRGLLVSFGQSSGPVPPVSLSTLAAKGSLYLTRPTLRHFIARREDLLEGASELLDLVGRGVIRVSVGATYPLRDAARAHQDLEGRRTTGSVVLIP
jgi:NADPH2:quinone reductase